MRWFWRAKTLILRSQKAMRSDRGPSDIFKTPAWCRFQDQKSHVINSFSSRFRLAEAKRAPRRQKPRKLSVCLMNFQEGKENLSASPFYLVLSFLFFKLLSFYMFLSFLSFYFFIIILSCVLQLKSFLSFLKVKIIHWKEILIFMYVYVYFNRKIHKGNHTDDVSN